MKKTYVIIPTECNSNDALLPLFKKENLTYSPWLYLHGELENESVRFGGWDKFKWFGDEPTKDGIFDCVVLIGDDDANIKVVKSIAYLWKSDFGKLTGLVVAEDDQKSVDYAHKNWEEKATMI